MEEINVVLDRADEMMYRKWQWPLWPKAYWKGNSLGFLVCAQELWQVRRLHARVDFNGSGALDLAEFVRFMRFA